MLFGQQHQNTNELKTSVSCFRKYIKTLSEEEFNEYSRELIEESLKLMKVKVEEDIEPKSIIILFNFLEFLFRTYLDSEH